MEVAAGGLLLDLLLLLQQLKHEIKISKQEHLYVYIYSLNIINPVFRNYYIPPQPSHQEAKSLN